MAQYVPNIENREVRVVYIDLRTGTISDTQVTLRSGNRFSYDSVTVPGSASRSTRLLLRSEGQEAYPSPVLVGLESRMAFERALSYSELAHLVSPCGRWLSCGCWLTSSPLHGVEGSWFAASIVDIHASRNGMLRRVDFADGERNSIISSFSADGNFLLLGWRARRSSLPWEAMEIFDVNQLFDAYPASASPTCWFNDVDPVCRFSRSLALSGDTSTRLAITWAGDYVLVAEVSGISVLDPRRGGAQIAVLRADDLVGPSPVATRLGARILNIFCHGHVALVWQPTNRAGTIGSMRLCELATCRTLLTIADRIKFYEQLGETVYVSDDCRTVTLRRPDSTVQLFDCYGSRARLQSLSVA